MADGRPIDVIVDTRVNDLVDRVWQALDVRYRVLVVGAPAGALDAGHELANRHR